MTALAARSPLMGGLILPVGTSNWSYPSSMMLLHESMSSPVMS